MKSKTTAMRVKRLLCAFLLALFCATGAWAQMEFSFSGLSGVKSQLLHDGTMLVQLPTGSSLASLSSYGMSVKVNGTAASLSDIVPNPATKTNYVDGGLNVFYYKGKSYKVRFALGEYFTAVFFSNTRFGGASSLSKEDLTAFAERVTKMGTSDGVTYEFASLPGYAPKTDIAFFLGDMSATTSQIPVIHTLNGDEYKNIVNKCAVVTGQIEAVGTNATITEYGLCLSKNANPTTSDTSKAASDLGVADGTFGDFFQNVFGVYFDDLDGTDAGGVTYHYRAYCKYRLTGSNTVYTTYGEDRTFTTPGVSGFHWQWEGGQPGDAAMTARIEEAMNGASYNYNHYCTFYKWCGVAYGDGTPTADCSLRQDGSCYMRFGPGERYQWVGTAQHEINHGYGVGQTGAYAGYPSPFQFRRATLTIRVFLRNMENEVIYHDGMHYWPGGINQREEVTNGTANAKGTYTCYNDEMLRCNAMILNGLILDGMQNWYGWAKERKEAYQFQRAPRKVTGNTDFESALDPFRQAGIPLILAPGELDLATTANSDGKTLNNNTYAVMTRALNEAQNYGVGNVQRFTNGQSGQVQAQPFTFTFKGVRFYNGQRSWFEEPMYNSGNTYRWIIPDGVFSNLSTFVNSHKTETSIWMQHLPMNASDADWFQTKTRYNTNGSGTSNGSYNSAANRRSALASLIQSTANAAMFSGHADAYNDNNYNNQFHDFTVANVNNTPCDAYIVLMKAGTGVVEVKRMDFRNYYTFAQQYDDASTIDYPAGEDNAKLAGLVQGMTDLNTGDATLNSAVSTATNVNSASAVTSSIAAINTAFDNYAQAQAGNVDVSALLGSNLNFETALGSSISGTYDKFYQIPGWNNWVNVRSTTNANVGYQTGQGSSNGGNTLHLYENWKDDLTQPTSIPSTIQVYKDAVLPAGTYILQCQVRTPSANFSESLNYYEVNGVRTTIETSASWETKSFQITVSEPATLRLSFGFIGNIYNGNRPCQVDVDGVTLTWVPNAVPEGRASMDEDWSKITSLPADYSQYFFTLFDHSQDLGMVLKAGAHQGSEYKTMWYSSSIVPGIDHASLWTFDYNENEGTDYVIMTSVTDPDHMLQTEYNAAYHFRTHDNGGGGIGWGRTILNYANSSWTVQNGQYPNDGYLGAWSGSIADNAEVALNKADDAVGHFDIYSILRGAYVGKYENLGSASTDNPINISYVLENQGGERLSTIGWKTDGNGWWAQGSNALGNKVGAQFLERWDGGGIGNTDLYQTVSGLPNGTYRFSAIAGVRDGGNQGFSIYANDASTAVTATPESGQRFSVIVTVTDGTLRLGLKAVNVTKDWIAFDDAKLEFLDAPAEYRVGEPQPSIADGTYIQQEQFDIVTIAYPYASSTEAGALFALLDSNAKLALYKGSQKVAERALTLNGRTLTADFSTFNLETGADYTLQLPADVVGFDGQVANDAWQATFHTPAVWNGTYYVYNPYNSGYLSRGGVWATSAILDDWGLAIIVNTNAQGQTTLKYFDSQAYLFNDGFCFGDGGTGMNFTVSKTGTNYKFQVYGTNRYLAIYNNSGFNRVISDAVEGDNLVGSSNVWKIESTADHVANYARNADAQAATAATAAGYTGITTKAALDAAIITEDVTITGLQAERYEWYAAQAEELTESEYYKETVENLPAGLYRLSVDAFQRACGYGDVAAADGARGSIYLYANDAKTQIKSSMEYASATAWTGGYDWDDWEYNGLHYPNSEPAAYNALSTGNYQNVVYVYLPTAGNLTFGINNPNRLGNGINRGTWAVFQNFRLERVVTDITLDEEATTVPPRASHVNVTFNRTLVSKDNVTSGHAWNTICFPFALTNAQMKTAFGDDVEVKKLSAIEVNGESATLRFTQVDAIEANKPYILQIKDAAYAKSVYTFAGIDVTPSENLTDESTDGIQFVGTYVKDTPIPSGDFYIVNDKFKKSLGSTNMKGYRAYFHMTDANIKSLGFDEGEATGIEGLAADDVEGPVYDLSGRLVSRPSKGMYIVNGKKVFIK